jgi:Homing endonuclease associated repeat
VAAGFEPLKRHYTRAEIVSELRRDAQRRGRPPRQKEWLRPTSEGPDIGAVARIFGRWGAGLRAAGLDPARRRWTNGEIVEALRAWTARHSRPPLSSDWRRSATDHPTAAFVQGRFGSWRAALEAAGVAPRARGMDARADPGRDPRAHRPPRPPAAQL